ncbi:MAG: RecQ family ATP-dependent DNA helicase [Flavobacteriaceae bacterium]
MDKKTLLKQYWGHAAFRPFQEEIIESVMANRDTFALLPTGGGKSLCYQLPALLKPGFVLVISPLVALMEEQVARLNTIGIKAMYFKPTSKRLSLSQQLDNALHGNFKVVYCSPERLDNSLLLAQLRNAPISMIAVDEAHCISEWGHDFRPAYRKIKVLKKEFAGLPFLVLTASATPAVVKDIQELLALETPNFFQNSFERPNIAYEVWNTEDTRATVVQLLHAQKGSSIIYCYSRKQTEDLAAFLTENGFKAAFFHAGLNTEDKKERLKDWQHEKIQHMVATTAFGMGIDKSEVRTVIHTYVPESIESYYQETGRAGRDGKPARTYLLYHQGALSELQRKIEEQLPQQEEVKKYYLDLCNYLQIAYGELPQADFDIEEAAFCKRYLASEKKLYQILDQLEKTGILNWSAASVQYFRIRSKVSSENALQSIQKGSPSAQVMEYLMRHSPQFFTTTTLFDKLEMSNALRLSVDRLRAALDDLQQRNYISYTAASTHLSLRFLVPREDQYTLRPVREALTKIKSQKRLKSNAVIQYIQEKEQCRRNFILHYFGEKPKNNCNQCNADSCSTDNGQYADLQTEIIALLKKHPHTIQALKQKLYFKPQQLEAVLAALMESQQIKKNTQHKFYWSNE